MFTHILEFFRKTFVRKSVRWLISLAFLVWVFWQINWLWLLQQIVSANLVLILIGTIIIYGFYWIFAAWRWKILLNHFGIPYSLSKSLKLTLIGFFAGFALSDSIGAFSSSLYVKQDGYSVKTAMATVFLDKIFELFGLGIFGLVGLISFSSVISETKLRLVIVALICTVLLFVWLFSGNAGQKLSVYLDENVLNKVFRASGKPVTKLYLQLRQMSRFMWLKIIVMTFLRRLAHYGAVYVFALSLGLSISYLDIVAIMSLVGLAVTLPIAVAGGLGVREGVMVGLFSLLAVSKEAALSLAFIIFLSTLAWRSVGLALWLKNPLQHGSKDRATSTELMSTFTEAG